MMPRVGSMRVVALLRGDERYILIFDEPSRAEALRTLARWASDPELAFTWYDAAAMSQKITALESA